MKLTDPSYLTDWYVISLRWIVILVLIVSLTLTGTFMQAVSLILIFPSVWNMFLMWMAGQNKRFNQYRWVCTGVDMVVAGTFLLLAGGTISMAAWIILLPLISASFYFNFKGGILSALSIIIFEGLDFFLHKTNPVLIIISAAITLALGTLFGYISHQANHTLQEKKQKQQAEDKKNEKVETDRLRAIYNMSAALTSTLSYKKVLDAALDLSMNALHVESPEPINPLNAISEKDISSAVLLFEGDQLLIGSSRRLPKQDLRLAFPAKEGILARVMDEGEPILSGSIAQDPELKRVIGFAGCNSMYFLPMRSGYNIYGVIIFGHTAPGYFTSERCDVLGIVNSQAVIAIQNARLYQDLADEKERMVEVQEEARKKLARDLHDGPTQSVSAIAMRVSLARKMLARDPAMVSKELEKIEDLARRTTKEIRHMLFTLRPLVLESQGLVAALHANAEKMKETYDQVVKIQVDENLASQLEMSKSGVIFYIAEEAINNARKHAKADEIWVRLYPLAKHPDIALLEISDNGIGFDVEEVNKSYDKRGSLGMINLHERAELVNGILNIHSVPGKGTKIQVFIPLSEEAADVLHSAREAKATPLK